MSVSGQFFAKKLKIPLFARNAIWRQTRNKETSVKNIGDKQR